MKSRDFVAAAAAPCAAERNESIRINCSFLVIYLNTMMGGSGNVSGRAAVQSESGTIGSNFIYFVTFLCCVAILLRASSRA